VIARVLESKRDDGEGKSGARSLVIRARAEARSEGFKVGERMPSGELAGVGPGTPLAVKENFDTTIAPRREPVDMSRHDATKVVQNVDAIKSRPVADPLMELSGRELVAQLLGSRMESPSSPRPSATPLELSARKAAVEVLPDGNGLTRAGEAYKGLMNAGLMPRVNGAGAMNAAGEQIVAGAFESTARRAAIVNDGKRSYAVVEDARTGLGVKMTMDGWLAGFTKGSLNRADAGHVTTSAILSLGLTLATGFVALSRKEDKLETPIMTTASGGTRKNAAYVWTADLVTSTRDRVGSAYTATKAKGSETYAAAKERVATYTEPVTANAKDVSAAWTLAPDKKTKAQVAGGILNATISGDFFDQELPYSFVGQKYAVVTINGMDNTVDDAKDMRNAAREILGVSNSAMISNEKGLIPFGQDVLQTIGYELLGLVDAPAINAAQAMKAGIAEKGSVYVLAHSQGSEVFHQALKLLTPEERSKVHYQGFGPETYIDGEALGLASARNVINRGDLVKAGGNGAKIASSVLQAELPKTKTLNVAGTIVSIRGQKWELVDSPANTLPYDKANNRFVNEKQYETTTNNHGFLKYYSYFIRKPEDGL
jgi:hypothetical protein